MSDRQPRGSAPSTPSPPCHVSRSPLPNGPGGFLTRPKSTLPVPPPLAPRTFRCHHSPHNPPPHNPRIDRPPYRETSGHFLPRRPSTGLTGIGSPSPQLLIGFCVQRGGGPGWTEPPSADSLTRPAGFLSGASGGPGPPPGKGGWVGVFGGGGPTSGGGGGPTSGMAGLLGPAN